MNHSLPRPPAADPLIAILGPTASGKSTLAVFLAQRLGGEVIACDSTQLYRGFDIGTAKPSERERGGIPHHLIDVLDPPEAATAGGYRDMAIRVLEDLRRRRKLPIFTVGTGLYFRALLDGLADVPQRSEELRARLRRSASEHEPGHLRRILRRLDPEAAEKIAAADEQKLIRAIEVCLLARRPISELHRSGRRALEGWHAIKIALQPERDKLYQRSHQRAGKMLDSGWLEEVERLVASGALAASKARDFIGYRELHRVLDGEMDIEQARMAIQQATRRYAKRQMTWFRRETGVHRFAGFGDDAVLQNDVLQVVARELADAARRPEEGSV